MGRQIRATGKTVDEAIWNGLNELGVSIDEVSIETVQKGSTGLLGIGAKPAIVMITEKESEEIDIKSLFESATTDTKETSSKAQPKTDVREKKPLDTKPVQVRPVSEIKREPERRAAKPAETVNATERVQRPQAERRPVPRPITTAPGEHLAKAEAAKNAAAYNEIHKTEAEYKPSYEREHTAYQPEADIPYSEEFAKDCPAAQFLSELLKRMGIEATVLAAEYNGALKLRVDTESAGVLIGHRGENLDALQYLTLLVANRDHNQKEYIRISIDTQGYREKREETLIRLAKSKASTVRANGRPYRFEPMSPYERRIIHSTLQSNPHVTTHSEGIEPHRYVVITSKHPGNHQRRRRRPEAKNAEQYNN